MWPHTDMLLRTLYGLMGDTLMELAQESQRAAAAEEVVQTLEEPRTWDVGEGMCAGGKRVQGWGGVGGGGRPRGRGRRNPRRARAGGARLRTSK